MIETPEPRGPRPPLPGWSWFFCTVPEEACGPAGEPARLCILVPAPDWASAEAALAEWSGYGAVEGRLENGA